MRTMQLVILVHMNTKYGDTTFSNKFWREHSGHELEERGLCVTMPVGRADGPGVQVTLTPAGVAYVRLREAG